MKFEYPTDSGNSSFLKGASNTMGFYPVGVLNNWHGGIHIEWGTRKIRSIADGYIIAYRLPEKSIRIEKEAGENKEKKKYSYSNGFILIRHQYVSPRGQSLAFYSLYNHLLPKEEYKEREIPACYNEYEVKSASRPKVGIRIWMDNTKNDGRSYFVPKGHIVTVVPDKKAGEGGNFEKGAEYKWVTAKNLQGDVIAEGYIKIGSTYVDVVEEGCYKVKHSGAKKQDEELEVWQDKECTVLLCLLSPGSKVKVTMYASNLAEVSVGDKTGYVKKPKDNLEAGWESGIKNDEICKSMIPVKAGEFVGFSGPYGCEESPDYRTAHIEVFTDDKKNLDRFLNNECAEGKKMFVKLSDKPGALKYKFLSGTRVEMVTDSENQGSYVQVTVHEAHVKVNRDKDLKKYTATQTYTFDDDDKFASLNNKLKGLLTEKGTVKLVKQPKDQTKEEREDPAVALLPKEREVSYASPLAGERFWINRKDLTAVGENGYMIGKRNISNPEVVEVDLYRQKPSENKEKQDISEHIVEISRLKEIVQSDVPDVKWYEVDSSVEDLDGNKCGEGFFKIDSGMQFSAFEWGKFGFHLIGDKEDTDRYLYDLSPQPENTLIGYVQSLVDGEQGGQKKNGILEPREFDAVLKDRDKVNKLSRLVCYHRNEWGYDSRLSGLMDEFKTSYDALIAEEKEEKYKQRLREKKEGCLNELEQKVKDLCFWKAVAGKYERLLTSEKSSSISPDYYEQLSSSAYLNPGIKLSENDGHPQMSETERHVETFDFPSDPHVCHFHPIAFVEQMKRMNVCYGVGDSGNVVREINFRLAGFGGVLPGNTFTRNTEKGVKQFQRDYMKMSVPTGIVDEVTLQKIDEFSDKYRENVENYKCKCGKCSGFGQGQGKETYREIEGVKTYSMEKYHKYEYPGMHQSLLWAVSAIKFYIDFLTPKHSFAGIISAYRCQEDNKIKKRQTTNHMGKSVDLLFAKEGRLIAEKLETNLPLLRYIRNDLFVKYLNTTEWLRQGFATEPIGLKSGETWSWIHIDVREFGANNLKDIYFIKQQTDNNYSKEMFEIKN